MSAAASHPVLQDSAGTRACLLGNLAIVRGALEAGVQFFSCYPGTPSSEIGDTFARIAGGSDLFFEYSVNEKVAVEIAFAASLAGARTMCSMKHLGLNYANDPVSTMPYVGVEGGMVIVSAGDPSAITSPNEQDQRHFTRFLFYPVFDPATPEDCRQMTRYAFDFSEQTRLPVLLRPTTRVCHGSGMVTLGPLPDTRRPIRFTKDPPRYVPIPANVGRMRRELTDRYRLAESLLATSPFFPRTGSGRRGILASGVAYAYAAQVIADLGVEQQVTLQQIGAYPIPEDLLSGFLDAVDSVLVVEELTPFVEDWASLCAFRRGRQIPVLGQHSGHLPLEYEYSPELVEDAVRAFLALGKRKAVSEVAPDLPDRPPVLCPGCPHRSSLYLTVKVFGKRTVYCNDIGCYTLGYGEPLNACDVLLCMGSSISQASGLARVTGQRTVAFIGDSTFFHSGLPALANALQSHDNITVVILDNYVTAMTGFQPSLAACVGAPPSDATTESPAAVRDQTAIERAVRGLGVANVWAVDPFDEGQTVEALKKAKGATGVNVVICQSPCVVHERKQSHGEQRAPFVIDGEKCNACSLCVRLLGCPGILITNGEYIIDEDLCDGCALCADVCGHDAIHSADRGSGS